MGIIIFFSLILLQSHRDGVAFRPVAGFVHRNDFVFQGFTAWLVGQDNGFGGDAIHQYPVSVRQFTAIDFVGRGFAAIIRGFPMQFDRTFAMAEDLQMAGLAGDCLRGRRGTVAPADQCQLLLGQV